MLVVRPRLGDWPAWRYDFPMSLSFPLTRSTNLRTADEIAAINANPGFGSHFTDHMAVAVWTKDGGWGEDAVVPYGPFAMDPAAGVLHYAQEIFEGIKAFRHADGSVWIFRPHDNAARFNASARRMVLPELPTEDFVTACTKAVEADARWVPTVSGSEEKSLYLRPFEFGAEVQLGVRAAARVQFAVILSPVGPYFAGGGVQGVDIWVTDRYSRAGVGGTGAAKCGGNYASSLIAQYEGYEHGCSQVLFIEASGKDRVEELGGMNVAVITSDGELVTPELSGTFLDGITRRSILTIAPEFGLRPVERPLTPDEVFGGIETGKVIEAFACGTAAVLTPIATLKSEHGTYRLANPVGEHTMALRTRILDIQYGRAEDKHGWLTRVC